MALSALIEARSVEAEVSAAELGAMTKAPDPGTMPTPATVLAAARAPLALTEDGRPPRRAKGRRRLPPWRLT
uniref:Uncharacterized protein n=1 Tax=Janibacter limosus TaxID=53458 RepID=A0AC61U6H2_9MICO|nr:hypothetical protein [Janibacter limosus]